MAEITAKKVILKSSNGQYVLPYVQPATTDALGTVKPDGVTITAAADGTISAAGGGSSYRPPLLSSIWSDHLLDNISWLRADTFSWHSGDVYSAVYNELLSQWNDWWQSHSASEVEGENGFGFLRTAKGYKIAGPENEQAIINTFESKGVAWYYILDIQNRRFKLPRTKFGFTGLRTAVGDVSTIYGQSTTGQPTSTQMYLYFYVGNFEREAIEQTAGLNAELFNGKLDSTTIKRYVTEKWRMVDPNDSHKDYWYEVYNDGWVRQSGVIQEGTVTLFKPMIDAAYMAIMEVWVGSGETRASSDRIDEKTATTFHPYFSSQRYAGRWYVEGQGAN